MSKKKKNKNKVNKIKPRHENTVEQQSDSVKADASEKAEDLSQDTAAESSAESVEAEPELSPEELLMKQLAEAQDKALRSRAEFENYRKRMAREMERVRKTAGEMIIQDILPGIDNLDLALQHADDKSTGLAQGVQMVFKQLQDALKAHGLSPIDALGQPFDPNVHEAVSQAASTEYEKDVVAQVFQVGYTLGDVVLRPSKVVVSTGAEGSESVDAETTTEQSAPAE